MKNEEMVVWDVTVAWDDEGPANAEFYKIMRKMKEESQLVNIAHMLAAFKEIAAILDTCNPEEQRRIIKSVKILFEIE